MRARIKVTDYAGTVTELEGIFAGWSDQVAFERHFGTNAAVLSTLGESFTETGELRPDADPSKLKTEWLAFLAWRIAARANGGIPIAEADQRAAFEAWLEGLADLDLAIEADEAANPTSATATPLPIS
jgi:hypothetical protein